MRHLRQAIPGLIAAVILIASVIGFANPAHAAMTIIIRLTSGQNSPISVNSTDTIAAVKQIIEIDQGIPAGDQRLIYTGRQMQDTSTLADYNVQDGATVYLVRRLTSSNTSSTAAPIPIPPWFQSYARLTPAETCAPGWIPSWAEWPFNRAGGWTCDRTIPSLGQ